MTNSDDDPLSRARAAPRCTARSKRTEVRCGAPAMRGKSVCYHHGGKAGGPSGKRNGNWKHGGRTRHADALRSLVRALARSDLLE